MHGKTKPFYLFCSENTDGNDCNNAGICDVLLGPNILFEPETTFLTIGAITMVTLTCADLTVTKKSANALIKAFRAAGVDKTDFAIKRENGENIVRVVRADCVNYAVSIGSEGAVRIIPAKEVVPTARLYTDAQRLRGFLKTAECMFIRPM